jgi:Uma2 family endonuclease
MSPLGSLQPSTAAIVPVKEEPLYEVVNGQKAELPPNSIYPCWIASRLQTRLATHAEAHGLGIVVTKGLFILDPMHSLGRRPDVAFVSTAKWPLDRPLPETGDWELVPDLAIEVNSPNDVFLDVIAKMQEYFHEGVREVWIVVPSSRQIFVFASPAQVRIWTAGEELDGGSLLPGLRLPVGSLFQQQPKAPAAQPAAAP